MQKIWHAIASVFAKLWHWTAVLWVVPIIYGTGVAVLLSGGCILAACLFGTAIAWITGKAVSSVEVSENDAGTAAAAVIILLGLVLCGLSMFWVKHCMDSVKTTSSATVIPPPLPPVQPPISAPTPTTPNNNKPTAPLIQKRHVLTNRERRDFENPLKQQIEPKQLVRLACPAADETVCIYAAQFINLFKESGWVIQGGIVNRVTLGIPFEGVRLFEHTDRQFNPNDPPNVGSWMPVTPSLMAIYDAFKKIGIESDAGTDHELSEQVITVYFGPPRADERASTSLTQTIKTIRTMQKSRLRPDQQP
jgi:hypothetical protein